MLHLTSFVVGISLLIQGSPSVYEPVAKHPDYRPVRKSLMELIKFEKGSRRQKNHFNVVVDVTAKQAMVYWKERKTIYLWEPGLTPKPEMDIALSRRRWNEKKDVCPPAQCSKGSAYMMRRKDYLKLLKACLEKGTEFVI